jgi:ParB family chromosome partitioning protein
MSAERVFAGTYITEVEVRERALAWVPEVMRFAGSGCRRGRSSDDART